MGTDRFDGRVGEVRVSRSRGTVGAMVALPSPDAAIPGPTRAAALDHLRAFLPRAGAAYRRRRNVDQGPGRHEHVSRLAPHLRRRLITEAEIVAAARARHGSTADTFVQEVLWRTHWVGWLRGRPEAWRRYRDALATEPPPGLAARLADAEAGRTGLACFDAWARELVATNYLHNHARMWFASIWTFTLGLPWERGADLFLRHLLDGDPASNTLSWRWVVGLQTKGKAYAARAENIRRQTDGRFDPGDALDEAPVPRTEEPLPAWRPPPELPPIRSVPTALLLTEDDTSPEQWSLPPLVAVGRLPLTDRRSTRPVAPAVAAFDRAAIDDAAARLAAAGHPAATAVDDVVAWARSAGAEQVLVPEPPVGWTREGLAPVRRTLDAAGLPLVHHRRPWDDALWPFAKRGFFAFDKKARRALPELLATGPAAVD